MRVFFLCCLLTTGAFGADCPSYRADATRSGYSPDELPDQLVLEWKRVASQAAAATLTEFAGNVALVPTDIYWDAVAQAIYDLPWDRDDETFALWQTAGSDRPYHYLGSAITFSDIGSALGTAVVDLINAAP